MKIKIEASEDWEFRELKRRAESFFSWNHCPENAYRVCRAKGYKSIALFPVQEPISSKYFFQGYSRAERSENLPLRGLQKRKLPNGMIEVKTPFRVCDIDAEAIRFEEKGFRSNRPDIYEDLIILHLHPEGGK